MSNESEGLTRKQFVTATAAGATAAITMGFSRPVQAKSKAKAEVSGITQTITFNFDTKRKAEAVAVLQAMCHAVEENEPGVLSSVCYLGQSDPSKVVFVDVFKDDDAIDKHWTTPHMKEMRKSFLSRAIGGGLLKPPTVTERLDKLVGFSR